MLENEKISHQGILDGPVKSTRDRCRDVKRVLAIQDSTSVRTLLGFNLKVQQLSLAREEWGGYRPA